MVDTKVSALTAATTPLDGTESLYVVQAGSSKKVTVDQLLTNDDHLGYSQYAAIADPATPPAGFLRQYAKSLATRLMPKFVGPSGLDSAIQPALFQNRVILWTPGTAAVPLYSGQTATLAATASHPTPTTTNIGSVISRTQFTTTTTAGNAAGLRSPVGTALIGNTTGRGGFFFNARFNQGSLHTNGVQKMVGLSSSVAALAGDPSSTMNDFIGMSLDAADTNWQFSRRTGAGAATKVNLGVGAAADQMFEITMFIVPSGTALGVRIQQYANDGTSTILLDTSYNTILPAVTTFLGIHFQVRNGALAAAHNMSMSRIYLESDF